MKRLSGALLSAILFLPIFAAAQSPFDGTWKVDMNKVNFPKKPDVFVLHNGMYDCKTCVPPISIKADGTEQKITGHPYFDSVSVKVVSDHEVDETDKKDGKVVGTAKTMVSSDGNTMTVDWTSVSPANGKETSGKLEETRVAKGPAGSHAISGSWRAKNMQDISQDAITYSYKVSGDEIMMSNPMGQSYTAKMDGSDAPMKGDPGTSTVSVKKLGKNAIEETDKRDGKVIGVMKATVSADGKSMHVSYDDKLHGSTSSWVATKQ